MGVDPTARSARKISGGSQKYRKRVDHRKGGSARKGGLQSGAQLWWCTLPGLPLWLERLEWLERLGRLERLEKNIIFGLLSVKGWNLIYF